MKGNWIFGKVSSSNILMLFQLKQDQNQEAGLKDKLKDDGGKNKQHQILTSVQQLVQMFVFDHFEKNFHYKYEELKNSKIFSLLKRLSSPAQ